ncbi:MAG: hypothetical protein ACE5FO_06700 [Parvularculaceae bacterium]
MNRIVKILPEILVWGGGVFISGVFLDSLRFKFTGHPTPQHIFTTLRDWSGIELFYPAGPWMTGLAELFASLLLIGLPVILVLTGPKTLIGKSQFAGAALAFAVMSGAIFFHLFTPLGIETPVEWSGGAPTAFSAALFYSACVSWAFAVVIMALCRKSLSGA